jgi:excisionase family DNA binding protein
MLSPIDRLTLSPAELQAATLAEAVADMLAQDRQQAAQEQPESMLAASAYLSVADAATRLGMSRRTVLRLIKSGKLEVIDYGTGKRHNYRIHTDALTKLNEPVHSNPRRRRRAAILRSSSRADSVLSVLPDF